MEPDLFSKRWREILVVAALLLAHWLLAVTSTFEKSATFDEVAHVVAGYFYWTAEDFRFNPESGNLTQRWAALPLLLLEIEVPPPEYPPRAQGNVWVVGRDVLFRLGNDAETMLFVARSMIALLSVALGTLVYLLSRRRYGPRGGTVSLFLYALSPTMLAHGRLVTADLSVAFFLLLSTSALGLLLERLTLGRLAAAGAAVAGLVLAKMSWLLLLPVAALLILVRVVRSSPWTLDFGGRRCEVRGALRKLGLAALVALGITAIVVVAVWIAFDGRFAAAGPDDEGGTFVHTWESRLEGTGGASPVIRFARDHRLLPEAFLWGLAYTLATTQERDAFLNGKYSSTGWWTFFPYAFLVKTPLPMLVLLLLVVGGWVFRGAVLAGDPSPGKARRPPERASWVKPGTSAASDAEPASDRQGMNPRHDTPDVSDRPGTSPRNAALWVLFGIYTASALASPLNLGHRHLLPLYPILFIFAGRAGRWLEEVSAGRLARLRAVAVLLLLGALALDSWQIRPHYLSYFNALAGGPENAHRHLVDSSLDWGQDLPALARELERRKPRGRIYAAYFGSAVPDYYGVEPLWLHSYFEAEALFPPLPLRGGTYCISATLLRTLHTGRPGPWTAAYEEEYQGLRREMEDFGRRFADEVSRPQLLDERSPIEWTRFFVEWNRLRSVRLFHFLARREPDGRAGYSILIFELTDEDVRHALESPLG